MVIFNNTAVPEPFQRHIYAISLKIVSFFQKSLYVNNQSHSRATLEPL